MKSEVCTLRRGAILNFRFGILESENDPQASANHRRINVSVLFDCRSIRKFLMNFKAISSQF